MTVTFTGQGKGTATGATEGTDTFTGVLSINNSAFNDVLKGSNTVAAGYWEGFNLSGGNDAVAGGSGNDYISYSAAGNAGINLVFTGVGAGSATGNGTDTSLASSRSSARPRTTRWSAAPATRPLPKSGGSDNLDGGGGT